MADRSGRYSVFVLEASTSNRLTYYLPPLVSFAFLVSRRCRPVELDHCGRAAQEADQPRWALNRVRAGCLGTPLPVAGSAANASSTLISTGDAALAGGYLDPWGGN